MAQCVSRYMECSWGVSGQGISVCAQVRLGFRARNFNICLEQMGIWSVTGFQGLSDILFEVPERAAEPERQDQLCDSDDHSTNIQVVAVDRDVAHHHVEHQQRDDETLHECIGDHTQHRCQLLAQVDTKDSKLDKQRLPVRLNRWRGS